MAIRTAGCIKILTTVTVVAEKKMHQPYFAMLIFGLYGVCGHLLIQALFVFRCLKSIRQKGTQHYET